MSGPMPIHHVPSQLNLPIRTNRDQTEQRKKADKQSSGAESDESNDKVPGNETGEAIPPDPSQENHIGTQVDVEA